MDFKSSSQTGKEQGLKRGSDDEELRKKSICLIQAAPGKSLKWLAMYHRTLSLYKPLSTSLQEQGLSLQVEASGKKLQNQQGKKKTRVETEAPLRGLRLSNLSKMCRLPVFSGSLHPAIYFFPF